MDAPGKLRAWRHAQGLTLEQAAGLVGFSQTSWSDWEASIKRPEIPQADAIERLTRDTPHHIPIADWALMRRKRRGVTRRGRRKSPATSRPH